MTKEQLAKIRDLLEMDNHKLGQALGFSCGKYQCKQIDNLIQGTTPIKKLITIAVECLARRANKLDAFEAILKETD